MSSRAGLPAPQRIPVDIPSDFGTPSISADGLLAVSGKFHLHIFGPDRDESLSVASWDLGMPMTRASGGIPKGAYRATAFVDYKEGPILLVGDTLDGGELLAIDPQSKARRWRSDWRTAPLHPDGSVQRARHRRTSSGKISRALGVAF